VHCTLSSHRESGLQTFAVNGQIPETTYAARDPNQCCHFSLFKTKSGLFCNRLVYFFTTWFIVYFLVFFFFGLFLVF